MQTVQLVLAVVGAVALGLPALIRVILGILTAIPGDQGEAVFTKALEWADKIAEFVGKLYPRAPSQ